ncbi:other/NAK protein kinase [Phellopilus nigrolimitatus]|nr:other/NAK protein kinase [Phellopilus nigrolimitatus]
MSLPLQLLVVLDGLKERAKDAAWALSSCLCHPSVKLKINGRTFKIVKVLGEGGFSFVYLAQDEASARQFALKKIRCPTGSEGVKEAMREVEAYRRFKHPNIIRILDSAVVQDVDGDGKIVYLFLPLYKRGNFQDAINAHLINGTHFSETEMLRLFRGTCEAVRAMHTYRASKASQNHAQSRPSSSRQPERIPASARPRSKQNGARGGPVPQHDSDEEDDDDAMLPHPEGDNDAGYSYENDAGSSVPLVTKHVVEDDGDVVFDGDQELANHGLQNGEGDPSQMELVPYAHRDLKPGNVMISDDGQPVLMDFGSALRARIKIENRQQALLQQDIAAEQSTMAYRAPELFDVKTGVTLDEKVDIWSLGCMLFALAYLHSPFETLATTEQGGSIAMAVMNAQYKHPRESAYSQGLRDLVDAMLKADPKQRPDIHQVIEQTDSVLRNLV